MAGKKKITVWQKSTAFKELSPQEQLWCKTGYALERILNPPLTDDSPQVHSIAIKVGAVDVLITLKSNTGEGPQIGFTGSSEPLKAVRKAYSELQQNQIKWKLDEWLMKKFDSEEEDW